MAWLTAGEILNDAAVELGLTAVRYDDPFSQTDQAIVQLCQLMKTGGRELVDEHDWSHLRGEFVFTTSAPWAGDTAYTAGANGAAISFVTNGGNLYKCAQAGTSDSVAHGATGPTGTTSSGTPIADGTCGWYYVSAAAQAYPLPDGWRDYVDQSGWNRTNRLPLGGPLSAQQWQALKARQAGAVLIVYFRFMSQKLYLYPDTGTPQGQTIALEYESGFWAGAMGATTPTKDSCSVGTDIVFFDAKMMLEKVKLKWLRAKGFDTTVATDDYTKAFDAAKENDLAAPVLSMSSSTGGEPLLSESNVPVTGFGS